MFDDLIERLEKTTGQDRELDVAILTRVLGYRDVYGDGTLFDRGNDGYWSLDGDERNRSLPSPTGSVDTARSLSDWVLVEAIDLGDRPAIVRLRAQAFNPSKEVIGSAPTIELAWCIAALKARHVA